MRASTGGGRKRWLTDDEVLTMRRLGANIWGLIITLKPRRSSFRWRGMSWIETLSVEIGMANRMKTYDSERHEIPRWEGV